MPNKFGFNGNFYYFYMGKMNCKILDTWSIVSEYKESKNNKEQMTERKNTKQTEKLVTLIRWKGRKLK